MSNSAARPDPPDQRERLRALDPSRSVLVQAPAGSGKTELLTRRYLGLLAQVDSPTEIVAITFTKAAAAEMKHRILAALEQTAGSAETPDEPQDPGEFSMATLARRALQQSRLRGWNLIESPSQLRISTIDSFCRELALQQPLLSGLGGGIAISEQPKDLYRRAARRTLREIDRPNSALSAALEALLEWRDNHWQDLEELLVAMLEQRDRWMHDFVLTREPDWDALRARLEQPFANAVQESLTQIAALLDQIRQARKEALLLARFACEQTGGERHRSLAELAEFPCAPFANSSAIEDAHHAHLCLADLLLTDQGKFRQRFDKNLGFPPDRKQEKARIAALANALNAIPGLEASLAAVRDLPPIRYTEDDWRIVRACFILLRHAAAELQVVFAEAGAADYSEVASIAQTVFADEEGLPTDAALAIADGIRHLLVDEFQDTSRRQHKLLAGLVAAWSDPEGRTLFAVGDPMQSIYFFRDADAELFPRVRNLGLELQSAEPLALDYVPLSANFRSAPPLIVALNDAFTKIFAVPDGSGIAFASSVAARPADDSNNPGVSLHLQFVPRAVGAHANPDAAAAAEATRDAQTQEIVDLIRNHLPAIEAQKGCEGKYRVAVLGRTKKSVAAIAHALREAHIPFRALDLEQLVDRPEVQDALALARALLNPEDRVAWLGVLRAPWCGLSLEDMHTAVSADDAEILARTVPHLLAERLPLLSLEGQGAAARVLSATGAIDNIRAALPNASLGTQLEQIWLRLGGADCVDATARANVDLLWSCLDKLPDGEQNLLGPALDAALEKLTALPNPDANSKCGIQLMTIHKAKGLEFEIVIVPDLQARGGRQARTLLSWLERGVLPSQISPEEIAANAGQSGEITEFLVAPVQSKGTDPGAAKRWVDHARREREAQEDRRILYVAATRAREELHLFAQPACRVDLNGDITLVDPTNNLLATAWPALEFDIRKQFDQWKESLAQQQPEPAEIEAIAAVAQTGLFAVESAAPVHLRRLPANYAPAKIDPPAAQQSRVTVPATSATQLYERHEGGLQSRAFGIAVHQYMENLARRLTASTWHDALANLHRLSPHVAAQARALGIDPLQSAEIAKSALNTVHHASNDPNFQWILSPHAEAASEARWIGVIDGTLHSVQVDRVFRAGHTPHADGADCWWIIDYKTYDKSENFDPAILLPRLRELFAPQLEAYAAVLRNLHGLNSDGTAAPIRAGLYYPRLLQFDWWEI